MRQILELVPIILFFVVYKMDGETVAIGSWIYQFDGIFSATAVLMIATILQVLLTWLITKEVEKKLLWLLAAVLGFGALTLLFRNELFIQWKPTIFNWGLAAVFTGTMLFAEKSLLQRMLDHQLYLPDKTWGYLNQLWIGNFVIVGALNLYVAYYFSEETWVSYKLYSAVGFTVMLMVLTMVIVYPHLKDQIDSGDQT